MNRYYHTIQSVLFFITVFILLASYYFEYYLGLKPCALCIMQRIVVFGLMFLFFAGMLKKNISIVLTCLQILFSLLGMYFAARQMWLQMHPYSHSSCLPDFFLLVHYMPWQQIFKALLLGTGDCGAIYWQWLGITMPGWVFLYFLSIFLLLFFLLCKIMCGNCKVLKN